MIVNICATDNDWPRQPRKEALDEAAMLKILGYRKDDAIATRAGERGWQVDSGIDRHPFIYSPDIKTSKRIALAGSAKFHTCWWLVLVLLGISPWPEQAGDIGADLLGLPFSHIRLCI